MVLEQEVAFANEEDAKEFVQFLRKKGCRAQKTTRAAWFDEGVVWGTYDNLIAWVTDELEVAKENDLQPTIKSFLSFLKMLKRSRRMLDRCMEVSKQGEIVFNKNILELTDKMAALIREESDLKHDDGGSFMGEEDDVESSSEKDESTLRSLLGSMMPEGDLAREAFKEFSLHAEMSLIFMDLKDGGLLEQTPEGFILVKKVSAGDIKVEKSIKEFPVTNKELIDRHGITKALNRTAALEWVITADPLVHLSFKPGEVIEFLKMQTFSIGSYGKLITDMNRKSACIQAILTTIKTVDKITLKDLLDKMDNYLSLGEDGSQIYLHYDEDFIIALVHELQKFRVLEGSDSRIRVVR